MKRALCFLLFVIPAICCCGQANISDTKKMIQGVWLSRGDSISELSITADSITTFRFRLNGVTACKYDLQQEPCEKIVKFPAATGIYINEHYKNKDVCCAFALISPTVLKIIYPDGVEVTYISEKMLEKVKQ